MYKAIHNQPHGLEIAVGVFAAQKAAVGNAENRDTVFCFRVFRFLFHIVPDDARNAGRGNEQAFGLPGFHDVGDTAPQFFHAAEDAVLFLQVGGNQRNRIHSFILVISDDAVLGAQIHQRRHVGAAQGTVEDDRAALAEAHRPPYAGHGAAAGFIFCKKPFGG